MGRRVSTRPKRPLFFRFYRASVLCVVVSLVPLGLFLDAGNRLLLLAGIGLALLLALPLSVVLARGVTRPVELLRRSAEAIGRGELGHEVRLGTGDELDELAESLNRMSRELAEQRAQIVAEKEQLLGVLEGMLEGVLVTDAKAKVVRANPALQQMFGLARSPVGKTSLEALRNLALEEGLRRTLENGERTDGTLRLSYPVERHLKFGVAPLGSDGHVHGAVAVFDDITRLERLEGVRRDFVANVSHEIRTPVTAIRGYAETLRDAAEGSEERARFAQIIIRHADRLTDLVDDLLVLSSLESAEYSLNRDRVSAADLLAAVEEAFRPRAIERGVSLQVEPAPADLVLTGDRRLLEQVLGNLVDNSIKYTEPGGWVRMSAVQGEPARGGPAPGEPTREEPAAGRDLAPDGSVVFSVADSGSGIPASDLQRVFERFFRVDRGRSRKLGGTGLGLSIVKHIVMLHGGRVAVRSRVGEGSEFTVTLPVQGPP